MSSTGNDDARVGELIERLLADAGFRAEFRADPAGSCRAMGLEGLAAELSARPGVSALESRESKSSLAGVVMAVAAEGVAVVELQGCCRGWAWVVGGGSAVVGCGWGQAAAGAAVVVGVDASGWSWGGLGGGHHPGQVSGAGAGAPVAGGARLLAVPRLAAAGAGGAGADLGVRRVRAAPFRAWWHCGGGWCGGCGRRRSGRRWHCGGGWCGGCGGGAPGAGGAAAAGGAAGGAAAGGAPGGRCGHWRCGGGGGAPGAAGGVVVVHGPWARRRARVWTRVRARTRRAGSQGRRARRRGRPQAIPGPGSVTSPPGAGAVTPTGGGGAVTPAPGSGAVTPAPAPGSAGGAVSAGSGCGGRCGGSGPAGSGAPGSGAGAPAGGGLPLPGGGVAGVAGAPSAAVLALLANPRLQMPAGAQALFTSGQADPRLVSLLQSSLAHHTITLGAARSRSPIRCTRRRSTSSRSMVRRSARRTSPRVT